MASDTRYPQLLSREGVRKPGDRPFVSLHEPILAWIHVIYCWFAFNMGPEKPPATGEP